MMAKSMIDGRVRAVFPAGTEVNAAEPPVARSDTAVIWDVELTRFIEPASVDSVYADVQLPAERDTDPWSVWIFATLGVVVLLVVLWLTGVGRGGAEEGGFSSS